MPSVFLGVLATKPRQVHLGCCRNSHRQGAAPGQGFHGEVAAASWTAYLHQRESFKLSWLIWSLYKSLNLLFRTAEVACCFCSLQQFRACPAAGFLRSPTEPAETQIPLPPNRLGRPHIDRGKGPAAEGFSKLLELELACFKRTGAFQCSCFWVLFNHP